MHVNVFLFPESSSTFNDLGNTELFASAEYRSLTDFEFLHHLFKGIIVIMSFLSLLDAASLLIGWGIIEEFFNVAPSDDGLSSKLLCLQFLQPKIIVDSTSANAKKLCCL